MSNLQIWGSNQANLLYGTDGGSFSPFMPENSNYTVFVDTLYRKISFWYNTTEEVEGITLRNYWIDPNSFTNTSSQYYLYAPDGLSNITAVYNATTGSPVPVFLSLPYFLQSDPFCLSKVDFLDYVGPNFTTQNTVLLVEPITGLTMAAKKRTQINLKVGPSFLKYPNMTDDLYFPVAYFELKSSITPALTSE